MPCRSLRQLDLGEDDGGGGLGAPDSDGQGHELSHHRHGKSISKPSAGHGKQDIDSVMSSRREQGVDLYQRAVALLRRIGVRVRRCKGMLLWSF